MTPSSDHATRTPGAITRRGFAWMLFVLLLPIMQASAARDCDVCPGPPESKPAPPAVDSTETGACDVCPKPENHDAAGAPSPSGKRLRDCADCPELVAIPVGSPASANAPGFALSTADITFEAWDACVAAGPCPPAADNGGGRGTNPVTNIDRRDARLYTAWITGLTGRRYRLPTPAEWERATRAGIATMPATGTGTFRVARDLEP